jgi:hypothetical protein
MKRFPREPLYRFFPDFLLYVPDKNEVKNHSEQPKLIFGEPQMVYESDDPVKARPYLVFLDDLKKVAALPGAPENEIAVDGSNYAMITRDGGLVIKRRNYFGSEEVRLSPWEFRFVQKVIGRYC